MPLARLSSPRSSSAPRRFVASLVLGGVIGPAPDRVRLWNPGINPWDGDPPINLTPKAVARVMETFVGRGNPLSMDFNHAQSVEDARAAKAGGVPEQKPSAGYCLLEAVETPEGLALDWLPRWSDCGRPAPVPEVICCAKHQIESGQMCEFSPDWFGDETTGEPIRVNRISLVGDGAMHGIGLLASRAAVERRATMDPMKEARAAYAYHARMASAGGENAKAHQASADEIKAHAAGLGVDLDKTEEAPTDAPAPKAEDKKDEQTGAEPIPVPKGPEDQIPKPKLAESSTSLASRAAQPLTRADLDRYAADQREAGERAQLLELNRDRILEGHRPFLASAPLAQVRAYVAGLSPKPAPAGTGGDTGGAIPPKGKAVRPWRQPLDVPSQFMASRIRSSLGITEAMEAEFDKRVDDDGGITISIVELADRQREARIKAKTRSAT